MLGTLKVAVVSGVDGCRTVRLEHVVLLKVLPVHRGHGALDALAPVTDAVDGGDGLSETAAVDGPSYVASEWGHVDLVGIAGEGLVVPEPVQLLVLRATRKMRWRSGCLPRAETLVVGAGGKVRDVEGLQLAGGAVVDD